MLLHNPPSRSIEPDILNREEEKGILREVPEGEKRKKEEEESDKSEDGDHQKAVAAANLPLPELQGIEGCDASLQVTFLW